jgi:hypothetical protein
MAARDASIVFARTISIAATLPRPAIRRDVARPLHLHHAVDRLRTTAALVILASGVAGMWASVARSGAPASAHQRTALGRADTPRGGSSVVDTPWRVHVGVVDVALARGDVSTAVRAWHDAYGAAMASTEWIAMLEVGDAFVRIGAAADAREGAKPNARQAYLAALVRARRADSVTGVVRAAQAFAALGDREVARAALGIADRLATGQADDAARARVQTQARTLVVPGTR